MDLSISVRQVGRRQPENKIVTETLVNVKSVEQALEWGTKVISANVPKDLVQSVLETKVKRSKMNM